MKRMVTLPLTRLLALSVVLVPMTLTPFSPGVLGQEGEVVLAKAQEPEVALAGSFPDDIESVANQWIEKLLVGARMDPGSKFVGKFFGTDPDNALSWTATIIAPSEAFRDQSQVWDRFTLTITTNFSPENRRITRRQTLINVEDYSFRNRSNSAVPSSAWAYRQVESREELRRRTEIAYTLGKMARKLSGKALGKISLSPISTKI